MNEYDKRMSEEYPIETNMFKRWWINVWYNDATRLSAFLGLPSLILVLLSMMVCVPGEYLKIIAIGSWLFFFFWMMFDNDYSNLRRIGLNEYRFPIKKKDRI